MATHSPSAPETVTLATDTVSVTLTPGRGLDVLRIVDVASGVDVLFHTPWGRRDPVSFPPLASREADWLARYPGGWQVLLPTAGGERAREDSPEGFHGEACIVPWTIEELSPDACRASVDLVTAPLRVERDVRVAGATLTIRESVTNLAPDPQPYHWVHHPAFGAPLLGPGTEFDVPAEAIILGGDGTPGVRASWPTIELEGERVDLSRIPERDRPRALFGVLAEFREGRYAIRNRELGLGVEVTWDLAVFPYAWFWQELSASPGYPWFRRAYVTAIEPATVIPGSGVTGGHPHGEPRWIDGGAQVSTELTLTLTRGD